MDIDRHPFERSFGDQAPKNHSISLKGIRKIIRTLPNEFTGDQFFEAMSKSRKTLSGSYSESFSTKVLKKALSLKLIEKTGRLKGYDNIYIKSELEKRLQRK